MGKSKSSGSSELDPAIKAMMQETFNVGKDTIMETVPVLDAQGNQVYDYSSGFPIPRTTTKLNLYSQQTKSNYTGFIKNQSTTT